LTVLSFLIPYSNINVDFNQNADLLGKNISVLGYPASAGNNITLTNGIISGTENVKNIILEYLSTPKIILKDFKSRQAFLPLSDNKLGKHLPTGRAGTVAKHAY